MSRLAKIVHKIANYVPWQGEGLTEDEFRVLDRASGEQLAKIAYNNQIHFNRFIKNAEKMIEIYNDNLVLTQIKEVRALKRCLVNPGSFSTQKTALNAEKEKSVTVQRAAQNNDDNVVPQIEMELPQNSPENVRHAMEEVPEDNLNLIENELAQTVPNAQTFVSSLLGETSGHSRSIPMQRNAVLTSRRVSLRQQNEISNVANLLDNDDEIPTLDEMQMVQMGVFDGVAGKKISKVLHQKEASLRKSLSINADVGPRNVIPLEIDVNPPSVDVGDNLLFTPDANDAPDLSPLPPDDQQQIELPQIDDQPQNQIIVEQINPENNEIPNINIEQSQHEIENTANGGDSMAERVESFRNAVKDCEGILGKARRVFRKKKGQQNQRQRQPQEDDDDELIMLKLRKEVSLKIKKRSQARSVKQIQLLTDKFDFFNDVEIFISNDLPYDEEQLEAQVPQRRESFNFEFDPITTHQRITTSTPMNTAQKNKRLNSSPEQLNEQPKRTRLENLDDLRDYLINLPNPAEIPNMTPIPEVPQEAAEIEIPASIPSISVQQPSISVQQPSISVQQPSISVQQPSISVQQPSISVQQPPIQTSLSAPQLPVLEPSLTIHQVQQESIEPPIIKPELPPQHADIIEPIIPQTPIQTESLPAIPEHPEIEMELPVAESSRNQSIPQTRKQSRLDILQGLRVTPESIDYDRLRRNSKLRSTPIDSRMQIGPEEVYQNACENISEREAARIRSKIGDTPKERTSNAQMINRAIAAQKPLKDKFRGLPRVMMNGELHVELKCNDGTKKVHYTEHQLSCLTLYFKIRFLMQKEKGAEPWRMTIKELFQKLKDLKDSKFVTYQQIIHMTNLKLFEAKWSVDDQLLEIEIPIEKYEEASDKENTPSIRRVSTRQSQRTNNSQL